MAQLAYNEISPRKHIEIDGEPYEVIDSHIFRKQARKPVNQTKLRHLITGKVVDRSFHQSDKVNEADTSKEDVVFIYKKNNDMWFHLIDNKAERFAVPAETIGEAGRFLTEKMRVTAHKFQDKIIAIEPPIKAELLVTEAPPADKGNTTQGGTKQVTLESGAVVNTPLFIKEGDTIRVNTQTGEYTERV